MNHTDDKRSTSAGADDALRRTLQATLVQPGSPLDAQALDALQARVLAQWGQRTASSFAVSGAGPVATLRRTLSRRSVQMGLAGLAIIAAVALQSIWTRHDPALDDLMEPDVLSLITLGEF